MLNKLFDNPDRQNIEALRAIVERLPKPDKPLSFLDAVLEFREGIENLASVYMYSMSESAKDFERMFMYGEYIDKKDGIRNIL